MFRLAFFLLLALIASPALADSGTQVPEGSAITLFALGALGVIIGRRGAMRPKGRSRDAERD